MYIHISISNPPTNKNTNNLSRFTGQKLISFPIFTSSEYNVSHIIIVSSYLMQYLWFYGIGIFMWCECLSMKNVYNLCLHVFRKKHTNINKVKHKKFSPISKLIFHSFHFSFILFILFFFYYIYFILGRLFFTFLSSILFAAAFIIFTHIHLWKTTPFLCTCICMTRVCVCVCSNVTASKKWKVSPAPFLYARQPHIYVQHTYFCDSRNLYYVVYENEYIYMYVVEQEFFFGFCK